MSIRFEGYRREMGKIMRLYPQEPVELVDDIGRIHSHGITVLRCKKRKEKKMKFVNLFDGYNEVEDFRILICASDIEEAKAFADEYLADAYLEGNFSISETENVDSTHYDCDYVIR